MPDLERPEIEQFFAEGSVDWRRPFYYYCRSHFSNRKHRLREFCFSISRKFDLQSLCVHSLNPVSITVTRLRLGEVPNILFAAETRFPFPHPLWIQPALRFEDGDGLHIVVVLPEDVDIGRKRSVFSVQLSGPQFFKRAEIVMPYGRSGEVSSGR